MTSNFGKVDQLLKLEEKIYKTQKQETHPKNMKLELQLQFQKSKKSQGNAYLRKSWRNLMQTQKNYGGEGED